MQLLYRHPVAMIIIHHAQQSVMMLFISHQTQLEAISASASSSMNVMLYDELFASQVPRRCDRCMLGLPL